MENDSLNKSLLYLYENKNKEFNSDGLSYMPNERIGRDESKRLFHTLVNSKLVDQRTSLRQGVQGPYHETVYQISSYGIDFIETAPPEYKGREYFYHLFLIIDEKYTQNRKESLEAEHTFSVIKANDSIVELNTETKKYYKNQEEINESIVELNKTTRNATYVIALAAIVSAVFTAIPYVYPRANYELKPKSILSQEKKTLIPRDKTLQYQTRIDSLYLITENDSLIIFP